MPSNRLSRRLICFSTSLLSSVLAVRMFLSSQILLSDEKVTSLAFVALMFSSFLVGESLSYRSDRPLGLGLVMGLPFGFFFCQASLSLSPALSNGADHILLLSGLIVAFVSLWPWLYKKLYSMVSRSG